jgi:hypothetical protein
VVRKKTAFPHPIFTRDVRRITKIEKNLLQTEFFEDTWRRPSAWRAGPADERCSFGAA